MKKEYSAGRQFRESEIPKVRVSAHTKRGVIEETRHLQFPGYVTSLNFPYTSYKGRCVSNNLTTHP